jgi:aryl-alcohol dehydrogenase-like predicted oxidoreductase
MNAQIQLQRALGSSGLMVPALGVGTNKWGEARGQKNVAVFQAFQVCLEAGLAFFDTAEVYTRGNSERLLGDCMQRDPRPVVVASKFAPLPTRLSPSTLMDALDESLSRLGVESIDLYYVHWPYTMLSLDALMDMMALAVRIGRIRAVGVSNFSARQMRHAVARLARYNIPLAANQVHYSLLHRLPEANGVLDTCRELNVALVASQPLESGRLYNLEKAAVVSALGEEAEIEETEGANGEVEATQIKLTPEPVSDSRANPLLSAVPGHRRKQEQLERLRTVLSTIAQTHNRTISQVALNWLLQRDEHIIPIPGATSARHVRDNLSTLEWSLSEAEFEELNRVSAPWKKERPG